MPFHEISVQQKIIIALFILTIGISCLSLVWFMVEQPEKKTVRCEQGGSTKSMKTTYTDLNGDPTTMPRLVRNCTVTKNPEMSENLKLVINIATGAGILFVLAAVGAYTFRKKGS